MSIEKEIKQAAKEERTIIGSKETLKNKEELEKVVIASNAPEEIVKKIDEELGEGVEILNYQGNNKELGSLCGKPFTVATVGIKEPETLV